MIMTLKSKFMILPVVAGLLFGADQLLASEGEQPVPTSSGQERKDVKPDLIPSASVFDSTHIPIQLPSSSLSDTPSSTSSSTSIRLPKEMCTCAEIVRQLSSIAVGLDKALYRVNPENKSQETEKLYAALKRVKPEYTPDGNRESFVMTFTSILYFIHNIIRSEGLFAHQEANKYKKAREVEALNNSKKEQLKIFNIQRNELMKLERDKEAVDQNKRPIRELIYRVLKELKDVDGPEGNETLEKEKK